MNYTVVLSVTNNMTISAETFSEVTPVLIAPEEGGSISGPSPVAIGSSATYSITDIPAGTLIDRWEYEDTEVTADTYPAVFNPDGTVTINPVPSIPFKLALFLHSSSESFEYNVWESDIETAGSYKGEVTITISGVGTMAGGQGRGADGIREFVGISSILPTEDLSDHIASRLRTANGSPYYYKDDSLWIEAGGVYEPVTKRILDMPAYTELPILMALEYRFSSFIEAWELKRFTHTTEAAQVVEFSYQDIARNYQGDDSITAVDEVIDQLQGHLEYTFTIDVGSSFTKLKFKYADRDGDRPADNNKMRGKFWIKTNTTNISNYQAPS